MPEWKVLNVRECVSGPKPKLCESKLPWKLKLNLLLRTRHTGRQQIMAYLLLLLIRTIVPPMFSPDVCHQKLLEIVHREEVKVNWILSAKADILNNEKGPREIDTSSRVHNIPHLSKRTPQNGARTEITWYLICEAADRCLLNVAHSASRFETHKKTRLKSISFQK